MIQGHDFIFFLTDGNGQFYALDKDKMLFSSVNPYILQFAPAGWDEIAIQNVRNKRLWGIDRSVTVPLSYVEDGAAILKELLYKYGHEKQVYLVICKQELDYEVSTPYDLYTYWYRQIYKGEVDLTTFTHAGAKVTCTTLEDGLPKYLKANENTLFEFPMNVPDAVNVKMDGIVLRQTAHFGITDGLPYTSHRFIANLPFLSTEGDNVSGILVSEINEDLPDTAGAELTYLQGSDNFFFKNDSAIPISMIISGVANFKGRYINPLVPVSISMYIKYDRDNGAGAAFSSLLFTQALTLLETNYSISYSKAILVLPGDEIFLVGNSSVNNTYQIEFLTDSTLNAAFPTRRDATYVKHFRPQYLFSELVKKVTEQNYLSDTSDFFQQYRQIVFTCGNAIRNMKDTDGVENSVMQLSLSTFFQFWDSFHSVSLSEKAGKVTFDTKENSVDLDNYIDLPEPSGLKVSIAGDYLYNELDIGYPEIKNDIGALNGNEEFNCRVSRSIGTVKKPAKLDKVSKIKASCYEQEKIRTTIFTKETTDYKSDNDVFVNYIEDTEQPAVGDIPVHYLLDRSLNSTATGLLEPLSIWNLRLSPARMLLNNGSFLRSSLYKCDSKVLNFISADKNSKVVCDGVTENANYQIGTLSDPFFIPVLFDFEIPAPDNLINLLDLNPLQVFRFPFYGKYYKGIQVKTSIAPSSKKAQQYQLLSVAENDLTNLIGYDG